MNLKLLVFLLPIAFSSTLTSINIVPGSFYIYTVTTYDINIGIITTIPSGGYISILFPPMFTALVQGTVPCSSPSSSPVNCTQSTNTLTISGCFPISGPVFQLVLPNVTNPVYAKTSSPFQINTYTSTDNLLDSQPSGPTITFKFYDMPYASISVSGNTGDYSTWVLTITTAYYIPLNGYIYVGLPTWTSVLGTGSTSNYCSGSQKCIENYGLNKTLPCTCSTTVLSMLVPEQYKGKLVISVSYIKNSPTCSPVSGFSVYTGYLDGYIERSSNINVTVPSPSNLTTTNFYLNPSNEVSAVSNYYFGVNASTPVPQYSYIQVWFPSDFDIGKVSEVLVVSGLSFSTHTLNRNVITISGGFSSGYLPLGTLMMFCIYGIANPVSSKPSDSITISILDQNNGAVAWVTSGLSVAASPGSISLVSIVPSVLTISSSAVYSFAFKPEHAVPAGGCILISLPQGITTTNTTGACYNAPISSGVSASTTCEIINQNIYIKNGFPLGNLTDTISVQISNINNPLTEQILGNFTISTYTDTKFVYPIDTGTAQSALIFTCNSPCFTCRASPDACTSCYGLYLWNNTCNQDCDLLYYDQGNYTCSKCSSSCYQCRNSSSDCISCPSGSYLIGNRCLSLCPDGYFGRDGVCQSCSSSCSKCFGTSYNCSSCSSGHFLYNTDCVQACPANLTINVNGVCEKCSPSCLTCLNSADYCTSCSNKLAYLGSCIDACPLGYYAYSGACTSLCSPGCTEDLLLNSVCDTTCNTISCNYDNSTCNVSNLYLSSLPLSQAPFPSSSVSALSLGTASLSKYFVPSTSLISSSIGMIAAAETGSWVNLACQISNINYTHGRNLLTDDKKILIAFSLIIVFLGVHFISNIVFVLVYYFYVIQKDSKIQQWAKQHRWASAAIVTLSCLISFKMIRILVSNFFGMKISQATLHKKSVLYRPLLIMTYFSIGTTSVPVICLLVYILSTYSSGNLVFIYALDTLITTVLITLLSIPDIVFMHKQIALENDQAHLPGVFTNEESQTDRICIETFKVYSKNNEFYDGALEDTYRNLVFNDKSKVFSPSDDNKFFFEDNPAPSRLFHQRGQGENPGSVQDNVLNINNKESDSVNIIEDPALEVDKKQSNSVDRIEDQGSIDEELYRVESSQEKVFNISCKDSGNINATEDQVFSISNKYSDSFSITEDQVFNIVNKDSDDQLLSSKNEDSNNIIADQVPNKNSNPPIDALILEDQIFNTDHSPAYNSTELETQPNNQIQSLESTETYNTIPQTSEAITKEILEAKESINRIKLEDTLYFTIIPLNESNSPQASELLHIESIVRLDAVPSNVLTKPPNPEDFNEPMSPKDLNESIAGPRPFEFEILDSSKEYIDDEHEPQLLDTILEESELFLSSAEPDIFDPQCVEVQHIPSGLKILIKKDFDLLENGEKIHPGTYSIEEIDSKDLRSAILRKSNSDSFIKAYRCFSGSKIVDIEMKGGLWIVGRTVKSEEDFDFDNGYTDSNPETVIAVHKMTGLKFKITKNFVGAVDSEGNKLEEYLDRPVVYDYDVHEGIINGVSYRRSFVGGLITAILDQDGEKKSYGFHDNTAFFNQPPDLTFANEQSLESIKFNQDQLSITFTEGFFSKKELEEFLPASIEIQTECPDNDLPSVSIEIQTENLNKSLNKLDSSLSLTVLDSIFLAPVKSLVKSKDPVLTYEEYIPANPILNSFDKKKYSESIKKFEKFGKIDEESFSSRSRSSTTKRTQKKQKKKKSNSKSSSRRTTPKNSLLKKNSNSGSLRSEESNKSLEAIYLQRLRTPGDRTPPYNLHGPSSESNLSISLQMSLNKLNMTPFPSQHDIEIIRKHDKNNYK